ncbi:hypothetical protein DFJ73DRAFT_347858 [Zopfochytrium polystomum]|nr:hypothetical protein DFJ73DRAFT_347858 [Zopfochytrium polystomum]
MKSLASLVALAAISLALTASFVDAQCFTLTGSTTCPDWSAYQVFFGNGESPFTDASVASFDSFMSQQADNQEQAITLFQKTYDCPGFTGTGLRYHITTLCGLYVDTASINKGCNAGVKPTSTCSTSAKAFLASAQKLFADSTVCNQNPSSDIAKERNSLAETVNTLVSHLGDNTGNCVSSASGSSEGSNCGFYDNGAAINYCNGSPTDSCCGNVSGFTAPSSASSASSTSTSSPAAATTSTKAAVVTSATTKSAVSSPSPTQQATTSDATTSTILGLAQPTFIGAVGGGLAVIVAVIVAVVIHVRRKSVQGQNRKSIRLESVDNERSMTPSKFNQTSSSNGFAGWNNGAGPEGQQSGMQDMNGGGMYKSGNFNDNYNNFGNGIMSPQFQQQPPLQAPQPSQPFLAAAPLTGAFANPNGPNPGASAPAGGIPLPPGLPAAGAPEADPNAPPETMEVVFNYVPNLSDEIYLYVGDPVLVKCKFDDGWGYGFNMTTKMEGSFPLACVAPYLTESADGGAGGAGGAGGGAGNRGDFWIDGAGARVERASFSIRQRGSSMYGPPAGFAGFGNGAEGADNNGGGGGAAYRASQFTVATEDGYLR